MNVKIIVYSYTGNTLEVAKRLHQELKSQNIPATLEEIKTTSEKEMDWKKISLTKAPLTDGDCLVFAAPVQAFRLVTVMSAYFHTFDDLANKPCFFFTTEFFPFDWLGGNQAKRMVTEYITKKNGRLIDASIIHWKKKNLEEQISNLIASFVRKIKDLS